MVPSDGRWLMLQVLWNSVVEKAAGNEKGMLGALAVRNLKTGDVKEVPVSGLFFAIGHEPASSFMNGQVRKHIHIRVFYLFASFRQCNAISLRALCH